MSLIDTKNFSSHDNKPVIAEFALGSQSQGGVYRKLFKRLFDLTAVLLSSIVVVPVVAILAALVALDGSNPFYVQDRIGKNGRHYKMWKLRSMVVNASAILDDYLAENSDAANEWHTYQKLTNDPRITRIGRILRKTSLDELPQLWNVFLGNMSLVGPRPMMPCQKSLYPGRDYYDLHPGITGMWQISSRNASTFANRSKYDTKYNRNLSLTTDLKILLRTVRVVLKGTGC